jgi:hypothetical protein
VDASTFHAGKSEATQRLNIDYYLTQKSIIEEYEIEEFENRICEAMEFKQVVSLKVWKDGFTYEIVGRVHYLEPIQKIIRLVTQTEEAECVKFSDIVKVNLNEN